ncbi:hypothetical protein BDZ89DRAFT_1065243 [Hymenopellis radicata]|nr:hypothetical protein BDZ89DRAFT_1065243 [Hymenopellis radicata]
MTGFFWKVVLMNPSTPCVAIFDGEEWNDHERQSTRARSESTLCSGSPTLSSPQALRRNKGTTL